MNSLAINSKKALGLLLTHHLTIAFAESCTGGLLAKSLTDHSGASEIFECGIVSYSGAIKHKLLGVREQTLRQYGEVSSQTAEEMARGITEVSGADIGISVTGIAGPGGGTPDKKVGLIFMAICYKNEVHPFTLELYDALLDREQRRILTADFAFQKLIELLN